MQHILGLSQMYSINSVCGDRFGTRYEHSEYLS